MDGHGIDCHTHDPPGPRLKCTRVLQQHSDLVKDTTRLRLSQKAEVALFSTTLCLYVYSCLPVFLQVELSYAFSTGIPAVFRPMSRSATVLARVDVCRARVWSCDSLSGVGFYLCPFSYLSLRESTCILSSSALIPFPDDAVGFAPKFREE